MGALGGALLQRNCQGQHDVGGVRLENLRFAAQFAAANNFFLRRIDCALCHLDWPCALQVLLCEEWTDSRPSALSTNVFAS